ncbi:MAG: hypothetical protein EXS42_03535 [Lacunisphaera sp.]|nr:hypothetical protein [Lacunisphaera sp.]
MRQQPSLALGLSLAKMALAGDDSKAAMIALGFAPLLKQFRPEDWPLAREAAALLAAQGARPAALQVYTTLARAKAPTPDAYKALLTEARNTADAAGDLPLSLDFGRQLNDLNMVPAN